MTGRDNRLNRERRVWHDYKFYMWWAAGPDGRYGTSDDALTAPPVNTNSVQTMCAGLSLDRMAALSGQGHWPVSRAGRRTIPAVR